MDRSSSLLSLLARSRWSACARGSVRVGCLALAAVPVVGCAFPTVPPPEATHDAAADDVVIVDLRPELPHVDVMPQSEDAEKFTLDAGLTNPDANCGAISHTAMKLLPDILLVQDRSLSMTHDKDDKVCQGGNTFDGMCGTSSKWYQVTTALSTVFASTDTMVNWGLLYFGDEVATCGVTTTPVVPVGAMTGAAITQAFVGQPSQAGMMGGTPTRSAMINAVKYMKSLTDTNPKYLLLATDGAPNCAPNGGSVNMEDATGAENAVSDALTAGFPTFVVGIGDTGGTAVLNAMAINGGKPVPGAPGGNSFYQVNNTADLEKALGEILGTVTTCVFDIGPPPNKQTNVDEIVVFGDGNKITHDRGDGWEFSNGDKTQVTLYGSVCDDVTSGTIKTVAVTFGCIIS